jgi:LEA14-like dessication related protein
MKRLGIISGVFLAVIIVLYARLRSKLKKVQFGLKPEKIKVTQWNLQSVRILLPIWIYNPSNADVILKNLDLGVYIDKLFLASIESGEKYMLKGGIASEYPVEITVPYTNLLNVLKERGVMLDDPAWTTKVNIAIAGKVGMETGLLSLNNIRVDVEDNVQNWTT